MVKIQVKYQQNWHLRDSLKITFCIFSESVRVSEKTWQVIVQTSRP